MEYFIAVERLNSWFNSENLSNSLQAVGMALDFIAFIGLYLVKIKPIEPINRQKAEKRVWNKLVSVFGRKTEAERLNMLLEAVTDEMNDNLSSFKDNIDKNDAKAGYWLKWGIWGFAIQLIGQLLPFFFR